jgi:hypothetical protein
MNWSVEVYEEAGPAGTDRVVESEALRLRENPDVKLDIARLLSWLAEVQHGNGDPRREPDAPAVDGYTLKYRCVGNAVMIFALVSLPPRVIVLRFGRSASAFPTVVDCTQAVRRWQRWR